MSANAAPPELDVAANLAAVKYAPAEQLSRVLWGFARILFRATPRPCYALRRWLLRAFRAKVGRGARVSQTAVIYFPWMLELGEGAIVGDRALLYNLGTMRIGARVTISQRAHLCGGSHDHADPAMTLLRLPITVEPDAWVCADAFIGPNVTIGRGAVVGARAAVFKDVAPWAIVGGNPAHVIGQRTLRSASSSKVLAAE